MSAKNKPLSDTDRNRAGMLVSEAIAEHKAILEGDKQMLDHAIKAGIKLNAAKEIIGHGRWNKWLQENLGEIKSARTARRYMRIAKYQKEIIAQWPRVAKMNDDDGLTSIRAADKLAADLEEAERLAKGGAPKQPKQTPAQAAAVKKAAETIKAEPAPDIIAAAIKEAKLPPEDLREIARAIDDTPEDDLVDQAKAIIDKLNMEELEELGKYVMAKAKAYKAAA